MIELTHKQNQALEFIKAYIQEFNMAPTVVEIAEFMDVYPNSAHGHVKALIKKGALTFRQGKMRSFIPVEGVEVVIKERAVN